MDAFEQIVAMLFERNGYWVQTSYKVCLTKDEKKKIGNPTTPRRELDIVAYRPKDNVVLAIECKSSLNSPGVSYEGLSGQSDRGLKIYKMFTDAKLRKVVFSRLKKQMLQAGMILPHAKVKLCLAAGHIRKGNKAHIENHCRKNGWLLFAEDWFREQFDKLAETDYENDIAIVAAKLAKIANE